MSYAKFFFRSDFGFYRMKREFCSIEIKPEIVVSIESDSVTVNSSITSSKVPMESKLDIQRIAYCSIPEVSRSTDSRGLQKFVDLDILKILKNNPHLNIPE